MVTHRDRLSDLGYSLRRYFVDEFHFRHVPTLPRGAFVLDLGGTRIDKRGGFDIEAFPVSVLYANLSSHKLPDVQAAAEALPFKDGIFDCVICSELLEHVPHPPDVISEVHRVLREGGVLLICVPFLNRIHADPHDYGRYTDAYWRRVLSDRDMFCSVEIEPQGLFWCVFVDMLRDLAYRKASTGWLAHPLAIRLLAKLMALAKRKALTWDQSCDLRDCNAPTGFTTGFGIRAVKSVPSR